MKKFTKLFTTIATFAIAMLLFAGIRPQQALAEQNTKDNGSVIYKEIKSSEELMDYIDNDGAYSSQDTIETDWKGYSDIHKIVLSKDGTLVVCALDPKGHTKFELFDNISLTNGYKDFRNTSTDRQVYAIYELKAGTYYYRNSRWNGTKPLTVTTYLGFIPKDGKIDANSGKTSTTTRNENVVDVTLINAPADLDAYIAEDGNFTSQDTIETKWSGEGKVFQFTVEEAGWLFLKSICNDGGIDMNVYSNVDLTSKIASAHIPTEINEKDPLAVYLTPGTYYYQVSRWNGYKVANITSYVAFLPSSARISVEDVVLSKDKTYATVTFSYDESYLPDFLNNTIRIEKGNIPVYYLLDKKVWKTDDRANAIESAKVKIYSNGTYTARIQGKADDYYCYATFDVKGIVSTPKTPKITSAKKNAYTIKGTATAGTTVIVKVNDKTYKTTANKSGKWSVSLKKKIAKKTKITVYCTNAEGAKSKTTKFTVK